MVTQSHLPIDLYKRYNGRNGGNKGLLLKLPGWSLSVSRHRKLAAGAGPLVPSGQRGVA